eukprot:5552490-Pyramimonas_sp.AAC.1
MPGLPRRSGAPHSGPQPHHRSNQSRQPRPPPLSPRGPGRLRVAPLRRQAHLLLAQRDARRLRA